MNKCMDSISFKSNGCPNNNSERQKEDFYATEPIAVEKLLSVEKFSKEIHEPCVGMGHIAKVLEQAGYKVYKTDLYDRGYSDEQKDIFEFKESYDRDIITNPPYKDVLKYVKQCYKMLEKGHKMALMLKLTFLEGIERKKWFEECPPNRIWVHSKRVNCMKNGDPKYTNGAVAYGWFIWEQGYKGDTIIKWL